MITIEVDNSYSQIKGLTSAQFAILRKVLSYEVDKQTTYFSGGFAARKYLIDKKGYFPSGLLYRVKETLKAKALPFALTDLRTRPKGCPAIPLAPSAPKPYHDQTEALDFALALEQGIISMPTGTGKSMVIALLSARLGLYTLVVVPTVEIKSQLTESLDKIITDTSKILVENIDSPRLANLKGLEVLIIDEAHHVAASTYTKLNRTAWKDIYYRFMFTATPFRTKTEENLIFEGIAGRVIYKLAYKDAVVRGYIVPVEAFYVDVKKQEANGTTWAQVYSELIVNNTGRNDQIAGLLTSLQAAEASTLCLVKEIKHGELLSRLTGIPFTNGQDEESRKYIKQFNTGKIKALIGTTGVISEGVDTKACEYVIVAGLGKAKSGFMQSVGRCLRTYPGKDSGKVIIFRDSSHKFCSRHYAAQRDILRTEYGVELIKLEA